MFDSLDNDILSMRMLGDDTEFIPLMPGDDENSFDEADVPASLPILPLRNTILFPGIVMPITVGRDKSIRLIREAYDGDKIIGVVAQKDAAVEDPLASDLFESGTVAQIIKMLRMPDGSTTAIIQGKRRFTLDQILQHDPYIRASIHIIKEERPEEEDPEFESLVSSIRELAGNIIQMNPNLPSEAGFALSNIEHPGFLVNFISSNLNASIAEKQKMLAMSNLKQRATQLLTALHKEYQLLEIKQQIHSKVKTDIDKQQREYFLHQQMKTIQEELGTGAGEEVQAIKKKAESLKWPEAAQKAFAKEMAKLERMNPMVAEYSVQLNYLEFVTDLPWEAYSDDAFDLKKAARILDRDHYGLEKVKQRVLEHLAVLKRRGDMKAPILCLVGPPGVGKTSLGKSIAEALGRKYSRMSLGGVRDESEIRGHRRTYIGAMAGRLLQNLKKSGTSNPVFILDEIDKLSRDVHGDPASALLEVLDPEQNQAFHDNFLDMDYDLSKVLFIATANDLGGIPRPLLDRMEIIRVPGYATEEKIHIATRHLIPKQLEAHGMKPSDLKLSKKQLTHIIDTYTRESGVRSLERKVAAIVRRKLVHEDLESTETFEISEDKLPSILGAPIPREHYGGNDKAGVVTGLAYTASGGDVLYIESSISPGRGKLTLTGNLGGVMKESALLAMEYLKAQGQSLGIKAEELDHWNVHVHVPEGAVPKDGPSAGVTMLTALASLFTQRKVNAHLAMTGEITLRGQVLPVGGIKEKVLAARRSGIKTVLLPDANRYDFEEINPAYTKGLKVIYVHTLQDVLDAALSRMKVTQPINLTPTTRTKQNRD